MRISGVFERISNSALSARSFLTANVDGAAGGRHGRRVAARLGERHADRLGRRAAAPTVVGAAGHEHGDGEDGQEDLGDSHGCKANLTFDIGEVGEHGSELPTR